MEKICVIEDNESIRELIVYALQAQGYEVFDFKSSALFWSTLHKEQISLIILDVMLPDEDGITILKKIRKNKEFEHIPIIMLTAKGEETDKLKGFTHGADDYVVKPFSVLELVARIKVFLKRSNVNSAEKKDEDVIQYKDLKVHLNKRNVYVNDVKVDLTYKEFELLTTLLNNKEIVLSREKLLNKIWGYDYEGETRTVDMHIKTLRKKLKQTDTDYIKTVRGVGYKIGD